TPAAPAPATGTTSCRKTRSRSPPRRATSRGAWARRQLGSISAHRTRWPRPRCTGRSSILARCSRRTPELLDALPDLRSVERPQVAAQLQLFAAIQRLQARPVGLAVVRIEHFAAAPGFLVVGVLLQVSQDHHAEHGLVLALVGALVARGILFRRVEDLLDLAAQHATRFADAHQRFL